MASFFIAIWRFCTIPGAIEMQPVWILLKCCSDNCLERSSSFTKFPCALRNTRCLFIACSALQSLHTHSINAYKWYLMTRGMKNRRHLWASRPLMQQSFRRGGRQRITLAQATAPPWVMVERWQQSSSHEGPRHPRPARRAAIRGRWRRRGVGWCWVVLPPWLSEALLAVVLQSRRGRLRCRLSGRLRAHCVRRVVLRCPTDLGTMWLQSRLKLEYCQTAAVQSEMDLVNYIWSGIIIWRFFGLGEMFWKN